MIVTAITGSYYLWCFDCEAEVPEDLSDQASPRRVHPLKHRNQAHDIRVCIPAQDVKVTDRMER